MNTTENNKLIAEFLCTVQKTEGLNDCYIFKGMAYHIEDLPFESDWNWLMPVVEKCRDTDHYQAYTHYKPVVDMMGTLDILNVYQAVIEFIKWYNEQQ